MNNGSDGADDGASALAEAPIGSSMAAGAFAAIVSRICTRAFCLPRWSDISKCVWQCATHDQLHLEHDVLKWMRPLVTGEDSWPPRSADVHLTSNAPDGCGAAGQDCRTQQMPALEIGLACDSVQIPRTRSRRGCRCRARWMLRPCTAARCTRSPASHGRRGCRASTAALAQFCWALRPPR